MYAGPSTPFSFVGEGEKCTSSSSTYNIDGSIKEEDIKDIDHRVRRLEEQNRKKKKNPNKKPLYKKNNFQDKIKKLV